MATSKQTFQTAQQRRANKPLRNGEYKLKETHNLFISHAEEVRRIADMKNCPNKPEYRHRLRHCTQSDCGNWLKGLPNTIADFMGYNVIPAIDAFVADGLSSTDAKRIKGMFSGRINDLIRGCDSAQRLLKQGISVEYRNFKRGDSILAGLVDEAESIVNDVLREYTSAMPSMGSKINYPSYAPA